MLTMAYIQVKYKRLTINSSPTMDLRANLHLTLKLEMWKNKTNCNEYRSTASLLRGQGQRQMSQWIVLPMT